jgi:mono/diheme cytochrome c family protein
MKRPIPTVTAFCLVVFAGTVAIAQIPRGNPGPGQQIYQQHCLRCHGPKLDGKGPDSDDLIVRPANLTSAASRSKSDWELLVTISNGALFTPMHSFRGKLNDQQMVDVLAYIRSVAPSDSVS